MNSDQTIFLPTEIDADGLESNLGQIARMIFSRAPQPPNTYGLQLDHQVPEGVTGRQMIRQILTMFLARGITYKYGDQVKWSDLNQEQIDQIQAYMASIGYQVEFTIDYEHHTIEFDFKKETFSPL